MTPCGCAVEHAPNCPTRKSEPLQVYCLRDRGEVWLYVGTCATKLSAGQTRMVADELHACAHDAEKWEREGRNA